MFRPIRRLVIIAAGLLSSGCLFLPARAGLERIQAERPEPDHITVFRRVPAAGEKPLADLRATLEYWSGIRPDGAPRWKGVLVPEPADLYGRLLEAIGGSAESVTLRAYRYDAVGHDEATLVDYVGADGVLLGWDHVVLPPDTTNGVDTSPPPHGSPVHGYFHMAWWEIPQLLLDIPVYLAIGVKELAGEVVKTPISFVSSAWLGPAIEGRSLVSPVSLSRGAGAVAEDFQNGLTAFTWRFRVRSSHTPLDLLRDLAGAVPVVGPLFDWKTPPEDTAPPPGTSLIALSHGLHAGGEGEQYTVAWKQAVEETRPEAVVRSLPYRYGGFGDTIWSLLNISSGSGYDLAARIAFEEGVAPGDGVEILGFSGGVERARAASRALRTAGITVNQTIGVAGPVAGASCARESVVLLAAETFDDPVVFYTRFWDALLAPFPSNVAISAVPGAGGHHLPYFPNGATRAPELGYAARLEAYLRS
jgi:hypothetical protein